MLSTTGTNVAGRARWIRMLWWPVLALAMLGAGFAWALASPIGAAPDEGYHMASIYCPPPVQSSGCQLTTTVDSKGKQVTKVLVPFGASDAAPCYAFVAKNPAVCPGMAQPDRLIATSTYDQGAYPGVYYRIMHLFAGHDAVASVITIRMVNFAAFALLLLGLGLVAPPAVRRLMAITVPVTSVPLGIFVVVSVNPSSWAITGVLVCWLGLHLLAVTRSPAKLGVIAGLTAIGTFMAAASRVDSAAYLIIGAAAILVADFRLLRRRPWLFLAPLAVAALGAYLYLSSGQLSGDAGSTGGPTSVTSIRPSAQFFYNVMELPGLLQGMVGGNMGALGWLDTPMPALTVVTMTLVVGCLIFVALREIRPAKALAMFGVLGSLIGLPLWVLYTHHTLVGYWVQSRYLLPLFPLAIGIALLGRNPFRTIRLSRAELVAIYLAVIVAQAAALHRNIRRYTSGTKELGFNLNNNLKWWWDFGPGPMKLWALGCLSFAVAAACMIFAGTRTSRRPALAAPQPTSAWPVSPQPTPPDAATTVVLASPPPAADDPIEPATQQLPLVPDGPHHAGGDTP